MIILWNNRHLYKPWSFIDGCYEYNNVLDEYLKKESCSILHEMHLMKGSKIKMQARIIFGSHSETAPNTVRFRIKKVSK